MPQRERLRMVAGNWKMNTTYTEGRDLARAVTDRLQPSEVMVVLGTPYTHLMHTSNLVKGISNLELAAQNCHFADHGAYTGEISAPMLRSVGVRYVILGHSERRAYFGEDEDLLKKKVDAVLSHGMQPIFCVGETLDQREAKKQEATVKAQIEGALFHLDADAFGKVVVAYEPVWAIGTGKTASDEQAQEMHAYIRGLLAKKYGNDVAQATTILYGGSVKPANAKGLFAQPDVDGGLIGGASLHAEDFVKITQSF